MVCDGCSKPAPSPAGKAASGEKGQEKKEGEGWERWRGCLCPGQSESWVVGGKGVRTDICFLTPSKLLGDEMASPFPPFSQVGAGRWGEPSLEMQPGCSTGWEQHPRAEFRLCLLWHIPLPSFSSCSLFQALLPLSLPLPDQVSGAEQTALGQTGMLTGWVCRWQGGTQSQAAMRSTRSQRDGNPSALGRERGW